MVYGTMLYLRLWCGLFTVFMERDWRVILRRPLVQLDMKNGGGLGYAYLALYSVPLGGSHSAGNIRHLEETEESNPLF